LAVRLSVPQREKTPVRQAAGERNNGGVERDLQDFPYERTGHIGDAIGKILSMFVAPFLYFFIIHHL